MEVPGVMSDCQVITYPNDGTRPVQQGLRSPVSIGGNYDLQFPAIWAPPSVGRGGEGGNLQYGCLPFMSLCFVCVLIFPFKLFFFYVAQLLTVYNKMKAKNYGHQ